MTDTHPEDQQGAGEKNLDQLRLTPEERIIVLETALDILTIRISDEKTLIVPSAAQVRLLQDQVRLVASQLRSYEKLEELKKQMGLAGQPDTAAASGANEKNSSECTAPAVTGAEPSSGSAPAEEPAPATPLSRAERRRRDRMERKKNKSALKNGAERPSAPSRTPELVS